MLVYIGTYLYIFFSWVKYIDQCLLCYLDKLNFALVRELTVFSYCFVGLYYNPEHNRVSIKKTSATNIKYYETTFKEIF